MIKILVVEPAGQLWGSEQTLLTNLATLEAADVKVSVCLPPGTPLAGRLSALGISVHPSFVANLHRKGRWARLRALSGLFQAARRSKPDVLHVNQAGATRLALLVGRLLNIPVTSHVQLAEDVEYLEGLGPLLNGLSAVICISDDIRSRFREDGPVPSERLVTIYNPVPLPDHADKTSIHTGPFVACVGRLVQTKGADVLLDALAEMCSVTALRAVFVGSTSDESGFDVELCSQAKRLDIADRVEWVGFDPVPARHLAGAVASVCPSWHEAFGLVVVEAWAANTIPIVWRGAGGAAEIVEKSGGGLMFDEMTGSSLAGVLCQASGMGLDERARLVAAGLAWAKAECNPWTQAGRMADVWAQAARCSRAVSVAVS